MRNLYNGSLRDPRLFYYGWATELRSSGLHNGLDCGLLGLPQKSLFVSGHLYCFTEIVQIKQAFELHGSLHQTKMGSSRKSEHWAGFEALHSCQEGKMEFCILHETGFSHAKLDTFLLCLTAVALIPSQHNQAVLAQDDQSYGLVHREGATVGEAGLL